MIDRIASRLALPDEQHAYSATERATSDAKFVANGHGTRAPANALQPPIHVRVSNR
jgi:hypothetical protein